MPTINEDITCAKTKSLTKKKHTISEWSWLVWNHRSVHLFDALSVIGKAKYDRQREVSHRRRCPRMDRVNSKYAHTHWMCWGDVQSMRRIYVRQRVFGYIFNLFLKTIYGRPAATRKSPIIRSRVEWQEGSAAHPKLLSSHGQLCEGRGESVAGILFPFLFRQLPCIYIVIYVRGNHPIFVCLVRITNLLQNTRWIQSKGEYNSVSLLCESQIFNCVCWAL